ncbi:hypothetical protein ARMGADRAFT_147090 [Armillaria gallica]|uniref:Uncharacterized protein n=1 Tax=Armillaria gallica TaxID=47427 RepID=A0A2H3DCZ4_ARMGA|nr:hypothetical protein ARMGADRAFT_147090 [Armillaria gallica]
MAMVMVPGKGFFAIVSSRMLTFLRLLPSSPSTAAPLSLTRTSARTALDLVTKHREALTRFRGETDSERRKEFPSPRRRLRSFDTMNSWTRNNAQMQYTNKTITNGVTSRPFLFDVVTVPMGGKVQNGGRKGQRVPTTR